MTARKRRLDQIMTHRERELEQKVAALTRSQQAQTEAERRAGDERDALKRASEQRGELVSQAAAVLTWIERDEWLQARARKHAAAVEQLTRAQSVAARARVHVLKAHTELKKIQTLSSRIVAEEKQKEQKLERRAEDETAQAKHSAKHRRGA